MSSSSTYFESASSPSGRLSHSTSSRQQALACLQSLCSRAVMARNSMFSTHSFCQLFSKSEVHKFLFKLFDEKSNGRLAQSQFVDFLNEKLGEEGRKFVNLFDATAYIAAGEADLDFQLFSSVLQNQKLLSKLFKLIDFRDTRNVSVQSVIVFFMDLSLPRKNKNRRMVSFESIEELSSGRTEFTTEDFKKLIPFKDAFFAERVFHILCKHGSNGISTSELRVRLEQLCCQSVEDKVRFLFQIYDGDGDGLIQLHDLRLVLRACTEENKMNFSDEQLDQLALALYEDAVDSVNINMFSAANGLKFEHLKAQLEKHPGLIDELSFSVFWSYLRNNAVFMSFLTAFIFLNFALFINRAAQYRDGNPAYIVARACGQVLNFNCSFVVVLMLNHCITWIRQTRLAIFLPLDHHVYFHKLCGFTIVLFGSLHTAMHMINFSLDVADQVVSPVTNRTHSVEEWLFTTIPGLYGLIPGVANLTGWGLLVILGVMIPCSLPFVRKTGLFELFYWSHFLYYPFWALLILHGPHFWYWLVGPAALFIIVEKLLRMRNRMTGKGRTFINYALLLPSRVTHIVCRKPPHFNFHPGDYVYLNIPAIASYEWHPFTISSAPELPDLLCFHIRGVGGWTNKLYEYFKQEQIKQPSFRSALLSVSSTQSMFQPNALFRSESTATIESVKNTAEQRPSSPPRTTRRRNYNPHISIPMSEISMNESLTGAYRYMRHPPEIINLPVPVEEPCTKDDLPRIIIWKKNNKEKSFHDSLKPGTSLNRRTDVNGNGESFAVQIQPIEPDAPQILEGINIYHPLEITIDGPYGTPSSHIFRAQHAVLIAAGIGVTPFASILQSIMHRYYASLQTCPTCQHSWTSKMPDSIMNLKKVDFFWINRDQRSFEWFVHMLSQLEMEQAEMGSVLGRFLDLHMYITSALKKTDLKAVGLQMALDLLHAKEKRDLLTGLKTRTNAGRPNWDKVFQKLVDEDKGNVTVFYCGPPQLSKELKKKCNKFGFNFRKEIF